MADIVRDAVVRLGIEQVPVNIVAPDLSPILQQIEAMKQAAASAAQSVAQAAANAANESTATASAWETGLQKVTAEYREAKEATASWEAGLRRMSAAQEAAAKQALAAAAAQGEAAKRAAEETAKAAALASAKIQSNLGELQSGFDRTVGGLAGLAGGFGLLKAASAEGLDPAIAAGMRLVGTMQAAKAGIEIYQGVAKAQAALVAIQEIQAASAGKAAIGNTANAGAIGLSGAAAALATPAMIAFAAAALPITVAVTAIAATLYKLKRDYDMIANAAQESARIQEEAAKQISDRTVNYIERQRDAIRGYREDAESLKGVLTDSMLAGRVGGAESDAMNAMGRIDNNPMGQQGALSAGSIALGNAVEAAKLQEQRVQLAAQELSVAENINSAQMAALEAQDRAVQNAKQLLDTERERTTSLRAQVGALDEAEQAELRRLAAKVKGGQELQRAELERFGQLGGGITRDFVDQQMANRGRGLAAEVGAAVGVDTSDTQANQMQQSFERAAAALERMTDGQGVSETMAQMKAERDAAVAVNTAILEDMEKTQERFVALVTNINKKIDDIEGGAR